MAASDRGTLVHAVLESFFREYREQLPLSEASLAGAQARVDELLDAQFERFQREGRAGARVVAEADRERIRPHLRRYLAEGGLKPANP